MKNLLCISLSLAVIFLFSGLAFATANQCDAEGKITLSDAGDGPGCADIGVSAGSYVGYSGALTAGGYGDSAGQIMCCVTASSQAERKVANIFAVRSNQAAAATDDNNVYQFHKAADAAIVLGDVTGYTTGENFAAWHKRGSS